jgi:nucleotide-binding universal stress UspA family protein
MEQHEEQAGRIVVGVDGSDPSKSALRWAAKIAAATGGTVEAVSAWHYPQAYGWPVVMEEWHPEADTEKVLQETLDEVFGPERPLGLQAFVVEGNARDVLLTASEGAEMLVVGSRGHGGFTGLLLGSVSAACAEHARCPVVVVHGEDGAR